MSNPYIPIIRNGFWSNNPGIVQLLGLCPLLAVSATVINGLGLGIATTFVLLCSNIVVSLIRNHVSDEIRIPVFVLIIASLVTCVELIMNAWFHQLYRVLGIFIPLIVTNCAIIGRAEAFASRNPVSHAAVDGLAMGAGFTMILVILGGMRELIGRGTLLSGAHMLFGDGARDWTVTVLGADYPGFLLAILPPGAFFGLGLLIALKNWIDARWSAARVAVTVADTAVSTSAAEPR